MNINKNEFEKTLDNLPKLKERLKGRKKEMEQLDDYLFKKNHRFISISGPSGIGKTTLALNFAHEILKSRSFNAIVWVTAKRYELRTKRGFLNIFNPTLVEEDVSSLRIMERTWVTHIEELISIVLSVSGHPVYQKYFTEDVYISQNEFDDWMRRNKILIILDDLDSWDWGATTSFISKIPPESAVIVTSRREVTARYIPGIATIHLNELPNEFAMTIIDNKLKDQGFTLRQNHKNRIINYSEGNPLLIQLILTLIIEGLGKFDLLLPLRWLKIIPPKTAEESISQNISQIISDIKESGEAKKFLFDDLYKYLSDDHKFILLLIAVYTYSYSHKPTASEILSVSSISLEKVLKILEKLELYALIDVLLNGNTRYGMHDLVSEYVRNLNFENTRKIFNEIKPFF